MNLDQIQSLLDDIDNAPYVSDWEAEFLDQMLKLTDARKMPSEKQIGIIQKIHSQRVK